VSQAPERVRQAAQRKKEKFTALLHHISIDSLRMAFFAVKRNAASGVDGLTWIFPETGRRMLASQRRLAGETRLCHESGRQRFGDRHGPRLGTRPNCAGFMNRRTSVARLFRRLVSRFSSPGRAWASNADRSSSLGETAKGLGGMKPDAIDPSAGDLARGVCGGAGLKSDTNKIL
jgi:hypothetical protein